MNIVPFAAGPAGRPAPDDPPDISARPVDVLAAGKWTGPIAALRAADHATVIQVLGGARSGEFVQCTQAGPRRAPAGRPRCGH